MTTHADYPTQDAYGRPVRAVLGRTGQLLGFARNDARRDGELESRAGAIAPTPEGAYPEPPARDAWPPTATAIVTVPSPTEEGRSIPMPAIRCHTPGCPNVLVLQAWAIDAEAYTCGPCRRWPTR